MGSWTDIVKDIGGTIEDVVTLGASGAARDAARLAKIQAAATTKAAKEKAALDKELAETAAANQRELAAQTMQFGMQQELTRATMQQEQMLVAQEHVLRQQEESERVRIGEERRAEKVIYEKGLRAQAAEGRRKKVRLRPTILTSPLGILGDDSKTEF